jgi:hypothetical protein
MPNIWPVALVMLLCMTASSTPPSPAVSHARTQKYTIACFLSSSAPHHHGQCSRSTSSCPSAGGCARRLWWRREDVGNGNSDISNNIFYNSQQNVADKDVFESHSGVLYAKKQGGDGIKKPSKEKLEKIRQKEEAKNTGSASAGAKSSASTADKKSDEARRVAPNIGISVKTQIRLVKAAEVGFFPLLSCLLFSL